MFLIPLILEKIMMRDEFRAGMEFKIVRENGSDEIVFSYIEPS